MVYAGYRGMLVLIDELVNLFKIPHSATRQSNYEKILTIYNDVLQGKAQHIGFLIGGTPQCIEDKYKACSAMRRCAPGCRRAGSRPTRSRYMLVANYPAEDAYL